MPAVTLRQDFAGRNKSLTFRGRDRVKDHLNPMITPPLHPRYTVREPAERPGSARALGGSGGDDPPLQTSTPPWPRLLPRDPDRGDHHGEHSIGVNGPWEAQRGPWRDGWRT